MPLIALFLSGVLLGAGVTVVAYETRPAPLGIHYNDEDNT